MATAHREDTDHGEDNFILEIHRIKERIQIQFVELRDCLSVRENTLIEELENILARYCTYKMEVEKITERRKRLKYQKRLYRNDEVNKLGKLVEKAGVINYTDQWNNCVKVFDSTAKYLFKFGDSKGENKMSLPTGLTICGNRILISQSSHCIMNYQLDGKFISKVGKDGNGNLEFNYPQGITIDELNRDVYICDYNNNRIQILSENLHYKSQFGKDILYNPCDIKLNRNNIFILGQSNPCLHIFNKDLVLLHRLVRHVEY
ncbi:E3 ubiquitin-protein ligase TRIM71-like [Oopsacas minuta]|uniref:E3 ubiquitin-protein ligase TRIM71-like n=1 Tax=Oopsacas minuta TaxID=111878 RepID=A0AAV7JKZ6_9METZ|nr:E3 ubiquitin-protein ligase TRIM71-like [Oopsacas minuta]